LKEMIKKNHICVCIIEAIVASFVFYIHIQHLKNAWQIWQYQLKFWTFLGLVLQIVFVASFITYLVLAIQKKQCKLVIF
jgi:hypothetical protein